MRSIEQLREQYEVERELADRLRNASSKERTELYSQVYNEFFRRIPHHPQLTRPLDAAQTALKVEEKMALLSKLLHAETVFLEIGAGDCRLSLDIARRVRKVYALEVSEEITKSVAGPPNFELVLSDGVNVPVPRGSVTLAYSYQVMEHIHPEDAVEQLGNIFRALAPGGKYVCITPNRLAGPHDISKHFDRTARGFHLKEYTVTELRGQFRAAGFQRTSIYPGVGGHFVTVSDRLARGLEGALQLLPFRLAHTLANAPLLRNLVLAAVVAQKKP